MKEKERIQELLSCDNCKFSTCEQCEISYNDKELIKKYIEEKDKIIDLMAIHLVGLTMFDKDEPIIFLKEEQVKQYFEKQTKSNTKCI